KSTNRDKTIELIPTWTVERPSCNRGLRKCRRICPHKVLRRCAPDRIQRTTLAKTLHPFIRLMPTHLQPILPPHVRPVRVAAHFDDAGACKLGEVGHDLGDIVADVVVERRYRRIVCHASYLL